MLFTYIQVSNINKTKMEKIKYYHGIASILQKIKQNLIFVYFY